MDALRTTSSEHRGLVSQKLHLPPQCIRQMPGDNGAEPGANSLNCLQMVWKLRVRTDEARLIVEAVEYAPCEVERTLIELFAGVADSLKAQVELERSSSTS